VSAGLDRSFEEFQMSISLYDFSISLMSRGLHNLSVILDKAAAHAEARKIDPLALAQARLFPDMFPLARQVQVACDTAKGAAARLAGIEIPKHEDTEVTLADLKQRVAKTLDFLKTVTPEQLKGAESRAIELKTQNGSMHFTGLSYMANFALPNFYFHESMAYALLRHNGVELGKKDFLGAIQ
jgi:hypothetical protein